MIRFFVSPLSTTPVWVDSCPRSGAVSCGARSVDGHGALEKPTEVHQVEPREARATEVSRRRHAKFVRDESTRARKIVVYEMKQKVSEGMANRVVGFLSALYGWASRTIDPATNRRYPAGVNPGSLVTKCSESPCGGRPLSDEEMQRFLEVVAKLDPDWRRFLPRACPDGSPAFERLCHAIGSIGSRSAYRLDPIEDDQDAWTVSRRTSAPIPSRSADSLRLSQVNARAGCYAWAIVATP